MSRLYRWPKKGLRFLYKVRHHKGHGVHSPFVYNLIRNVIEEKLPYYSYGDLSNYLSSFREEGLKLRKDNQLAFRLVNHFGSKNILEIGAEKGVNTLCLTSPSSDIRCIAVESNDEYRDFATRLYNGYKRNITQKSTIKDILSSEQFDCIYINLNSYSDITLDELDMLVSKCHEKSFILVKGIRRNKKQYKLWKCLSENENRTAELDLYHIGLIFFDKQLYRWRYQISY